MVILILFAALSGLVTVLSPCILPVLPIVLSSSVASGKARPVGVISGLIISFSIFTLAVTKIIALLGLSANTLRLLAVIVLAILGLSMVVPALNVWFDRVFGFLPRLFGSRRVEGNGYWPGFLTGASLGLIWAPCAGPILAAVTALAATQALSFGAALVVISYAIGSGIPLLAIAYGGRALIKKVPILTRNLQRVQQTFGVVMLLTAALIALNVDTLVTTWVTNMIPASWTATLDSFESSALVSNQLNQLKPTAKPAVNSPMSPQPTAAPKIPVTGNDGSAPGAVMSSLPNLGAAPELSGIDHWINSAPLTLQQLHGKVVLVDFWTYSCINCIRTLPYVTSWYSKYKDMGLVVIGVHTPEFAFEHDTPNVEAAVKRFNITYPVAQDNEYGTWQAFNNMYWPAEYLIDAKGVIRHVHFGEGNYDESEKAIQSLLAEAGKPTADNVSLTPEQGVPISGHETPETYAGLDRQERFFSNESAIPNIPANYTIPRNLPLHAFAVSGNWTFSAESAAPNAPGAALALHFYAKDVYLVMTAAKPTPVTVNLDMPSEPNLSEDVNKMGQITVSDSRLYHLVSLKAGDEGYITLKFDQPGVQVYAFTFGG